MDQNIFWDRKISEAKAAKILGDPGHPQFIGIAALLLSRTNDLRLVFSRYLQKKVFVRQWRRIKIEMRKNHWSDERIDLWGQVQKTLAAKPEFKKEIQRHKRIERPNEFQIVGQILRDWRVKQSFTQQKLAKKAGISQQTVSHAENGKGDLSLGTLKRIIDVLDLEFSIHPRNGTASFNFKE